MTPLHSVVGLRFSTGHALCATVLIPAAVLLFEQLRLSWLGIALAVVIGLCAVVTVRGRRLTGWSAALVAWRRRHRRPPEPPSAAALGVLAMPDERVAVRWQGSHAVTAIELVPRPFTPTVIVNGSAFTDDVIDTRLLGDLLRAHCPDLEADVVSAGYRVGKTAPASLVALYEQVIGPYPAPARRRTWIILRADPERTRDSACRRNAGIDGLGQYLVASTVRIAHHLSSNGIDARPADDFDRFDRATEIAYDREAWSVLKGSGTHTAAYHAPGGPDAWWSARADHTLTRVRLAAGTAPSSTVLLTTVASPSTPRGFSCLHGGQRAALLGDSPVTDRHHELPIGSAGLLVGETADRHPVYLPFDDVDVSLDLEDSRSFTQFLVRSAAAGSTITLGPQFQEFAGYLNARVGHGAVIRWPDSTTYLDPRPEIARVTLRSNYIATPRHSNLPIRPINPREEARFQMALEH
ncbi:MAG: type VII secretion protein EccE [Mycolicibacterium sp.]|uniref:type VII secretion protein EccE n=1 Tax=Mycolicibacterium sp. TaxID=2320850 RepID=UPI003D1294C9